MSNEISAKRSIGGRIARIAAFGGLVLAGGLLSGCYSGYGYRTYYGPAYVAPAPVYGYGYGCRVVRRYDPWTGYYRVRRVCY